MEDKHIKVVVGESSGHCGDLDKILQDQMAEPRNIPLRYLHDITNDFAEERELGRGAFGVVYKGVLQNGQEVAVKKLVLLPGMHDKHFENEVYHLIKLKHENIVRIVGYCYEIQHVVIEHNGRCCFAEIPHRLLCLELLPKGSLDKYISDESHGLDWQKRYKIILGICHGLHYLHEEWQTGRPIIHLDLKPENIFLDDNMVPKIADFGLSRLFDPKQTRAYTSTLLGSLGYMAPEYVGKGIITIKADIFSLGVIIIQIIAGHKNYPDGTGTTQDFVEHLLKKWMNRFEELKHTSTEKDCEQIKRCLEIGLKCVQNDAKKRPTTREIIESLDKWDSTILHVSNKENSPANKVNDPYGKKSDLTFDHRKEIHISKRLKIYGDYFGPEEGKPSPKDKSCTEILEQAEKMDQELGGEASDSFAVAGGYWLDRLLKLENRVAFARLLFPSETILAMSIAELDRTLEFTLDLTTIDLNETPYEMKEEHLARMRALSKTVELGKHYFPRCSEVLDMFLDGSEFDSFGRCTSTEKRRMFINLKDEIQKAFRKDKEAFRLDKEGQASPFPSMSTTIGTI